MPFYYTLSTVWGKEKRMKIKDRPVYKDRYQKLKEHIDTKDFITEDDIYKLSFSNPSKILKKYTDKTGILFDYIGNDKWVILR